MFNVAANFPNSLAYNSIFVGANNFKYGTNTLVWSYKKYKKLEQIDYNLNNHAFDDVICKPPTLTTQSYRGYDIDIMLKDFATFHK